MRNVSEKFKSIIEFVEDEKPLPFIAFKSRHLNEEIEGIELYEEIYGKDKVRTLHVVLVLCLNLAVDPPDILAKVSPCAKIEAWFDPREKNLTRALEMIGKNLQVQYERWQPKARYRQSLDPTIEEIHRTCQSLRRSAREDRVLFHYNGHGVPRPTENGEIWVFNKTYTKYIPLSLYDLHTWMGGPTVYVFDCNNSGRIIKKMIENITNRRYESANNNGSNSIPSVANIIILAACQENEDIPQNPEIPADLFTACLTTPVKTALHWYLLRSQEVFPDYVNESMLELIGGSPSNRVSMFGEINWVFTAVTDTIAWSCLPAPLFQKLFRQDLLVASLFRNFLLAERIMHYYGIRPVSYPLLPKTYEHPMWDAWDHALDCYLSQLPEIYYKKQAINSINNTENLQIISHPSFEPSLEMANNFCSNESSDEDDDDIDEEEDFCNKEKLMQVPVEHQKIMPRNILLTDDLKETINKNDRILNNNNRKPQVLPNPRMPRQNSQSSKDFIVSKANNLNPLNGPTSDFFPFRHTEFFNDHMTAFELWLKTANEKKPVPIQLPILLQVLLSQVHRYRALRLLSEYMDLGPWAVIQCLTVGIFPYVVRLLQSPVYDVKPYLVFIWGKIIASAQTDFAKNDVVKDAGYKYFVSCLIDSEQYEIIIRTISAFALAKMLNNNPLGQKLFIKQNFMTVLIEEMEKNPPHLENENYIRLRIWFILSFAKLWSDNDEGKWYGVRQQIHEKLLLYLKDISPEVRAATVYALGTFLNNKSSDGVRSKHSVQVEQNICQYLLNHSVNDSSPLVRAELVVAMKYMVNLFSSQVISMAHYHDKLTSSSSAMYNQSCENLNFKNITGPPSPSSNRSAIPRHGSIGANMKQLSHDPPVRSTLAKRIPQIPNVTAYNPGLTIVNIYSQMWSSLLILYKDPYPKVSELAGKIVDAINKQKKGSLHVDIQDSKDVDLIPSPKLDDCLFQQKQFLKNDIAPKHSALFPTNKFKIDPFSNLDSFTEGHQFDFEGVNTEFFNWSSKYFTQPLLPFHKLTQQSTPGFNSNDEVFKPVNAFQSLSNSKSFDKISFKKLPNLNITDPNNKTSSSRLMHIIESARYEDRNKLLKKQKAIKKEGAEHWTASLSSGGAQLSQVFLQKIESKPQLIKFHPYLNYLAVAEIGGVSLWNWESGQRAQYMVSQSVSFKDDIDFESNEPYITSLEFINPEEERGGLILVGTADGKIKIWKDYLRDMGQDPDIVTAWIALPDQIASDRPSGLVTHWSQKMGQLTITGDVKYIRIWDNVKESKISDMNTNSESCVSTIDRSEDGRLVVAGFGDGHIKLFDTRVSMNDYSINVGVGDSGWLHKVAFSDSTSRVYSIGINGELLTWSLKQRDSHMAWTSPNWRSNPMKKNTSPENVFVKAAQSRDGLLKEAFSSDSKVKLSKLNNYSLNYHPVHCADLRVDSAIEKEHIAVMGYGKEPRGVLTVVAPSGSVNSNFKFYEGFSRANIEQPVAVCVHPYQTLVGVGLEDRNLLLLNLQPK